jgi:polar amino acid transport system substrate-binding protein
MTTAHDPAFSVEGAAKGAGMRINRRRLIGATLVLAGSTLRANIGKAAALLRVAAAMPDPPFEFVGDAGPAGFDVDLMQSIAKMLGREWRLVRYTGADFSGIFSGLDDNAYDCIASGTTITAGRERIADFCSPYALSGQSLVVDPTRHPNVHSIAELKGLIIGVQNGNTSEPVAERLLAEHAVARVRVYAYDEIEKALDDLSTHGCDVFMKLAPVTEWFLRTRPQLKVVQTGITRELLGVSVRKGNTALKNAINDAQATLMKDGTVSALISKWLGTGAMLPS